MTEDCTHNLRPYFSVRCLLPLCHGDPIYVKSYSIKISYSIQYKIKNIFLLLQLRLTLQFETSRIMIDLNLKVNSSSHFCFLATYRPLAKCFLSNCKGSFWKYASQIFSLKTHWVLGIFLMVFFGNPRSEVAWDQTPDPQIPSLMPWLLAHGNETLSEYFVVNVSEKWNKHCFCFEFYSKLTLSH